MSRIIGFLFAACLVAQPGFAADNDKIVGTWKLVSYEVEVQSTGQKEPVMGVHPTGYVTFTPDGRAYVLLTADGRAPAKTDQERAALLNTLSAYTGTYSIEGEMWTTQVEVASNPEWVATKQVRNIKLEGDRLVVSTSWRVMANWADKGMTRSVVTFERSK
jgi:Lipocalin-like domain